MHRMSTLYPIVPLPPPSHHRMQDPSTATAFTNDFSEAAPVATTAMGVEAPIVSVGDGNNEAAVVVGSDSVKQAPPHNNGNGAAAASTAALDIAATNGNSADNGGGEENGEITLNKEDMKIEPPPKEDLMVDYTDEFGRVRTMRQRFVLS